MSKLQRQTSGLPLEFGHYARQRRAGTSAQGNTWETSLQWHSPPCKGGGSFRGLRPFRAPEPGYFTRSGDVTIQVFFM
jgi:hypothetical protein